MSGFGVSKINNLGQVVGTTTTTPPAAQATVWTNGVPALLPLLPGTTSGIGRAINDVGQVGGTSFTPKDFCNGGICIIGFATNFPTIWTNGVPTSLSAVGSQDQQLRALNNLGQAVGLGLDGTATLWSNGATLTLASPGGPGTSVANDINDLGQIAGTATIGGSTHAVVWNAGGAITADLGNPNGVIVAWAINNLGQVVGTSGSGGNLYAFVWNGGAIVNLNTLLDSSGAGWTLHEALDIDNLGQIVGTGFDASGQYQRAFLLTPNVPLPSALPLFVTGLSALGLLGWRTKRRAQVAQRGD